MKLIWSQKLLIKLPMISLSGVHFIKYFVVLFFSFRDKKSQPFDSSSTSLHVQPVVDLLNLLLQTKKNISSSKKDKCFCNSNLRQNFACSWYNKKCVRVVYLCLSMKCVCVCVRVFVRAGCKNVCDFVYPWLSVMGVFVCV